MSDWDKDYKGMKQQADESLDNSVWPAVIVLLGMMVLIGFIAWMIFGGSGCG